MYSHSSCAGDKNSVKLPRHVLDYYKPASYEILFKLIHSDTVALVETIRGSRESHGRQKDL